MKNIVVVGATSAMAEAVARLYAVEMANIYLLARNVDRLDLIAQDLKVRGANHVYAEAFDAAAFETHGEIIQRAFNVLQRVDVFLVAHGNLPDQSECEQSAERAVEEITVNGTSVVSLLTHAANRMEAQGSGNITVITSVAGVRGRQSNYVYGAAKGLVSTFLQGLSQRLFKSGVHVLDIKPGFVDTPMTSHLKKGALWAKPDEVAYLIKRRIEKRSNFAYVPTFWWVIMTITKYIPTFIFNRIKM